MSALAEIDQLITILYNERIKEQVEEIKRLRSIKTYGIYGNNSCSGESYIIGVIVCKESELLDEINKRKEKIIQHSCCLTSDKSKMAFEVSEDTRRIIVFNRTYYHEEEIIEYDVIEIQQEE